jgi:hypothetical protein
MQKVSEMTVVTLIESTTRWANADVFRIEEMRNRVLTGMVCLRRLCWKLICQRCPYTVGWVISFEGQLSIIIRPRSFLNS